MADITYGDPNGGTDPQQPVDPLIQLLAGLRPPPTAPGTVTNPVMTPLPSATAAPAAPPAASSPLYARPATPGYQPPSTVPIGVPPPQMPVAPTAPTIDLAKRAGLAAQLNKDQQPTNPSDPSVKPRWYDRLFGGLVGFGEGFARNPNAGEDATNTTLRRYNSAEDLRGKRVQSDQSALQQFDAASGDQQRNYEDQNQQFGHEMEGIKETRAQQSADSTSQLKSAQAERWAAMSPEERVAEVPEIEKSLGRKLTDEEHSNFILYGKPERAGKSSAANTPQDRAAGIADLEKSLGRKLTQEERTEYTINGKVSSSAEKIAAGRGGAPPQKPATRGEFSSVQKDRNKAWSKADEDYQKDYDDQVKPLYDAAHAAKNDKDRAAKMDLAKQADKDLTSRLFKSKQDAQDEYESGIETLGGGSKHVDVKGGPSARKTPPQQASQAIAARQQPPSASITDTVKTAPAAKGKDFGAAPAGSTDGRTGKLQNGTPVVVKNGRLVGA